MIETPPTRQQLCQQFIVENCLPDSEIIPLCGDASFRRYFRIKHPKNPSLILMDAPPESENTLGFSMIASALSQAGLNVPEVIEADFEQGLLLLSDLGDCSLLQQLQQWQQRGQITDGINLLKQALAELFTLQQQAGQHLLLLPEYHHDALQTELSYFLTWFVGAFLQEALSKDEEEAIFALNRQLIQRALKQPNVWVHRDFHSRNIMCKVDDDALAKLSLIDFQDALWGPITYDLVSLLKDCYVRYPEALIEQLLKDYYIELIGAELLQGDWSTFYQDFTWMGLQRHLKVLGVFARLSLRDDKHGYLADLPLTFFYVRQAIEGDPLLQSYLPLFLRLQDKLNAKLQQLGIAPDLPDYWYS